MQTRELKRAKMKIAAYQAMDDYYKAKVDLQKSFYNRLHQICDHFENEMKDHLSWKCLLGDAKHLARRMTDSHSARAYAAKQIYELRKELEPMPKGIIETFLEERHA